MTLLEEASGAARIAVYHWEDVFVIGWADPGAVQPVAGDEGLGGLLGALGPQHARDLTVCTAPVALELLVQQIATTADDGTRTPLTTPGEITRLGAAAAGTRLVRIAERADGLVQVEPHPSAVVTVPEEAAWLVRASDLGTECSSEHIEPLSLADVFGPASDTD